MKLDFEEKLYNNQIQYIVGCDEAGRGCLLGPVYAGAVILPKGFKSKLINDSKKLTSKQREIAFNEIIKNCVAYGVGFCTPEEIDKVNIYNASRIAMERAIKNMNHTYDLVLTDFMKLPGENKEVIDLVKGDQKSLCIAAASIIAKVSRDKKCDELDKEFPKYGIKKHKGYCTKEHLDALKKYGPIKGLYRFSYKPVKEATVTNFKLF